MYTICENSTALLGPPPFKSVRDAWEWRTNSFSKFRREARKTRRRIQKAILAAFHEAHNYYLIPNCFTLLSEPVHGVNRLHFGLISYPSLYTLAAQARTEHENAASIFIFTNESQKKSVLQDTATFSTK